MRQSFRALALG
uniref:Uncharacterized protein n=1 Tax=Anopheles quadriannulatus TaxID=34691 RepID=A0A182XQ64_ANOQN